MTKEFDEQGKSKAIKGDPKRKHGTWGKGDNPDHNPRHAKEDGDNKK